MDMHYMINLFRDKHIPSNICLDILKYNLGDDFDIVVNKYIADNAKILFNADNAKILFNEVSGCGAYDEARINITKIINILNQL